ncbi:hypothetical protein HanXRQr2_Chr14g0633931 [Helianthus annuus]|uniref:Uncharacterized protein n=1 Tax=Helianthus annuus TaxID=4232 RepID=A0A9K3E731_HELAN|nr:hypothetical protein HanXRQr2_Chr14g0633931 [Helianthus annuus]KAJ0839531.1 hypothetical protein HanPSC8_Chr14g0607961 [Helianthus annuus]
MILVGKPAQYGGGKNLLHGTCFMLVYQLSHDILLYYDILNSTSVSFLICSIGVVLKISININYKL